MKLWRALVRMYWEWVVDCCTDDIHDIEDCISFLEGWEYTHATRQLEQAREELAHAERKVKYWS